MTTTRKVISVLIVDDHLVLREGLRYLIEVRGDIRVVGEAGTGREAVALVKALAPDVVLMDIAMPTLNGVEATRQILASHPKTKVLVLSAHSDDEYVKRVVAMGAVGYLVKQTSAAHLVRTIKEVQNGAKIFSPVVARRLSAGLLERPARPRKPQTLLPTLTSREMEVVQLIAEGKANKQVADGLRISIKTVEKHRQNLMNKLQIHDTAGLTRYAISEGVVESSAQNTTD